MLTEQKCVPCNNLTPRLNAEAIAKFAAEVPAWQVNSEQRLFKHWHFGNFMAALDFVNKVGILAENEGHHPDIKFGWGYVDITIWTHAIKGLSENDFILAAKIEKL